MPISYAIDPKLDLVHVRWVGVVSYESALAHHQALADDPDFHPAMRQFTDASRAMLPYNSGKVRALALRSPFGEGSRRAVVVSTDAIFGASRMYAAQVPAGELYVFRNREDALDWLGVSTADLPNLDSGAPTTTPPIDASEIDTPPTNEPGKHV